MSAILFVLVLALSAPAEVDMSKLTILSPAFENQAPIPTKHTCEGEDVSPALAWEGLPKGTKSLALVVDDPDARAATWVHWVLYDLPPTATGLRAGVRLADLPAGTREGQNDWGRVGWRGPCPPSGRHRYLFKLYALDTALGDRGALTKAELESALRGHVLARAELVGTYQKKGAR